MAICEQEIPLILIIFLSSVGSVFLLIYQNFLCPKKSTKTLQKAYVGASILQICLGIVCVMCPSKTLNIINWILSGILILYFIAAFFLPSEYSLGMLTWSDFFLKVVGFACLLMRLYASLLLTYDRVQTKPLCRVNLTNFDPVLNSCMDPACQPNGVMPGSVV